MVRDIDQGVIMIVTDLHGNKFDYRQIMKVYQRLKEQERVDYLIFTGDLIHSYPGKKDESVAIVSDLIERGVNRPESDILCLLGNHELVHIYHIPLFRGHLEFTAWFERRIRAHRSRFVDFFKLMPFAVRTKGGVLVHHTGAARGYRPDQSSQFDLQGLRCYSHDLMLHNIAKQDEQCDPFGDFDPRVGELFMETPEGEWWWEVMMNGNELQYGDEYLKLVKHFLDFMSSDRKDFPLQVMVTGHIGVESGVQRVGNKHLRLCSSAGCGRDLEKKFLLFPADQIFENAKQLLGYCHEVY